MEQQAGTINPRREILDKAMESRIDLLQKEIYRLQYDIRISFTYHFHLKLKLITCEINLK